MTCSRSWLLAPAAVVVLSLAGCGKSSEAQKGDGRGGKSARGPVQFPVEVHPIESRRVQYSVSAVGSVEAFEQVQVTARVAGAIEKVSFAEGEQVKKGQVLVEIEPSRYRLAVEAARSALNKAVATRKEAEAALSRREAVEAKNPGLIPGEQLEQFRTQAAGAGAEASQAKVALDQAELNLHDAYVRAPVAGVIQTRTVQTGQYVQPGAVMATLVRRDPLLLRFQVPEQEAAEIAVGMVARFTVKNGGDAAEAKIVHVAEGADPSSRMVPVTAEVQGEAKERLRPGTFAQVTVPVGSSKEAPVVPETAVRPSEKGFLAFVVEDGKAKERVVELGLRTADGRVEVKKGLTAGEQLVVRGAEALRDGAPVKQTGAAGFPAAHGDGGAGGGGTR